MIFFSSDTHFSHPRVLRIDRRPFPTLSEHDDALIENWNGIVGAEDEVWHLGDFCRPVRPGHAETLLSRLNGRKHLMIGNNDDAATVNAPQWESVQHYRELVVDGTVLVLCHYPFRTWNGMGRKSVNLHGHSHGRLKPQTRQYDVGVDPMGLKPVSLHEILQSRTRRAS